MLGCIPPSTETNGLSTKELLAVLRFKEIALPLQVDNQNSKSEPSLYLFISLNHPASSSLKTPILFLFS